MKKVLLTAAAFLTMSATTIATAQVTIGSLTNPQPFSILELESADGTRGMRLPQMTIDQRESLKLKSLTGEPAQKALGLQIFNTTTECVETWNGTKWIAACGGEYIRIPDITPACANGVVPPPVRFMKYNLGADPQFDTPKKQIKYLATCVADSVGRVWGGRFQWGRKWEKNNSYQISTDGKYTLYTGGGSDGKAALLRSTATYDANTGQIINYNASSSAAGLFIYTGTDSSDPNDWRVYYDSSTSSLVGTRKDDLWGNGEVVNVEFSSTDRGVVKYSGNYYQSTKWIHPENNPCPDGFRVPTQDEWERICNYDCNPGTAAGLLNTSVSTTNGTDTGKGLIWVPVKGGVANNTSWGNSQNNYGGYAVYDAIAWNKSRISGGYFYDASKPGNLDMTKPLWAEDAPEPLLFLPAAGYRTGYGGSIQSAGNAGSYWSSTVDDEEAAKAKRMYFSNSAVNPGGLGNGRAFGFNIRCVVE
jgi:hypothetical protein